MYKNILFLTLIISLQNTFIQPVYITLPSPNKQTKLLNTGDREGITRASFKDLITEKVNVGEEYIVAQVTTRDSQTTFSHFLDANNLIKYLFNRRIKLSCSLP